MSKFSKSIVFLILGMFSIQTGASLAKQVFHLVGPAGATSLRVFFAAIILFIVFKPWTLKLSLKNWKNIILYGSSLGLMNLFFYMSLETIPLGIAVAIEFLGPLAVTVFFSRKWVDFIWIILAFSGVLFISPIFDIESSLHPEGILFALFAGVFWAGYIIFGQRAGQDHHSGKIAALGMIVCALVVTPVGLFQNGNELLQWSLLPIGLGIALLSSAIPYSLEMVALKNIPSQTFGILMSMEPAIATLSGFVLLKERLSVIQACAITLIIVASAGASWTAQRRAKIVTEASRL